MTMLSFRLGRPLAFAATVAIVLAVALGGFAVRHSAAAAAHSAAVTIDDFVFGPRTLRIARGTTVTWTNTDDEPHTVVSETALWKSPPLDTDDHFSFTFEKPGTYKYFCSIHPYMEGEIVVE
jgi:plastocyanin